jgi:hypothetical protein
MIVRPFDWHDLPALHRYRSECLFLDSASVLTSGPIIAPTGALLSSLSPASGIFTFLAQDEEEPTAKGTKAAKVTLIGQVTHPNGQSSAHMSFLAPRDPLPLPLLAGMVEAMAVEVGGRGAQHILAEVDSEGLLYERLRQVGFGVYARQRIWRVQAVKTGKVLPGLRRALPDQDTAAIRFLYANLVPGLVQQVEPPPTNRLRGMVFFRGNELLVYVEIRYGARGIWVQPFVHPDAETTIESIMGLLCDLPYRQGRPVYFCVRSYQSWLEPVIESMKAEPGLPQAVLVRHLALAHRQPAANAVVVLNGKTAEPTLPIVR